MAQINVGGLTPLTIPDELYSSLKSRVKAGEITAAQGIIELADKIDREGKAQAKLPGQAGTGYDSVLNRYGLSNSSFAKFNMQAQQLRENPNEMNALSAALMDVEGPKIYAPGSLQEDSPNFVGKEWPVQAKPTPTVYLGINENDLAEIAYKQRLAAMGGANPGTTPGAGDPATPIASQTPSFNSASGAVAAILPNVNLQPGATGSEVKKLQDYLVSKGYMTQAEVNTGYGTYGPQTTEAVKKLQESLGVDNSSGPGYWGPKTIAAASGAISGGGSASGGNQPNFTSAGIATPQDSAVTGLINASGLPNDQKEMLQKIYDAISLNDKANADKMKAAFDAATKFSEPYFKAQALIVTDALSRALDADEGDQEYQERKLAETLKDLTDNIAAGKDYLSFQHSQELNNLARSYEKDLDETRTSLASLGKTSSSVRSKAEQLLSAENQGLVESSNRKFSYQTDNLTRQGESGNRDYSRDLAYLKDKTVQDRIALLRKAESEVGSKTLADLGYGGLLGNIGGELERKKVLDANAFANSFVF